MEEASNKNNRRLTDSELFDLFDSEYIKVKRPYHLKKYRLFENTIDEEIVVDFEGTVSYHGEDYSIKGKGNGPIDAFFNALEQLNIKDYKFVTYFEHAVSTGADSKAVSYIRLERDGKTLFGVE